MTSFNELCISKMTTLQISLNFARRSRYNFIDHTIRIRNFFIYIFKKTIFDKTFFFPRNCKSMNDFFNNITIMRAII